MFHLLQTDLNSAASSSYLPVGLQIFIAVGLIVFLTVVTHLLGLKERRLTSCRTLPAELKVMEMPGSQWLLNIF